MVGRKCEGGLSFKVVNLRAMLCSSYCCIGSNYHLVCFAFLGSAFNSCMINIINIIVVVVVFVVIFVFSNSC